MISMVVRSKKITKKEVESWKDSLNFAQFQRLSFFETKLIWEGKVNRSDVCDHFGVTANHFTREIRDYKKYCQNNLEYDNAERAYVAKETFKPIFSKSDAQSYLSLLRPYSLNSTPGLMSEMGTNVSCSFVPEPEVSINEEILQMIIEAIHSSLGCRIEYISFSSDVVSTKKIWPHSLAWSGKRWHARSYDSEKDQFNDIVLSRIDKAELIYDQAKKNLDDDSQWNETETLTIVPNPAFAKNKQKAIAREYGMKQKGDDYFWNLECRKSMIGYFLDNYHLDEDNINTRQKLLKLTNDEILQDYSFKR